MNYIIVFILAWNFTCLRQVWLQRPFPLMNNTHSPVLARPVASKFQRRRKQLSIERTLSVLGKTKPKQSHSKPFFGTSNPVLSPITRIFDKFRTTFLCKTKPFYKYERWSMRYHKRQKMQLVQHQNVWCCGSLKTE